MRALRQLKAWLGDGTLVPGERIPGELVLAKRLRVARKTIRAALLELETAGRLENRGLAGRFAAVARPAAPARASRTIALITDITGEFEAGLPPGALSTIDRSLLIALDRRGLSTHLLRLPGFADPESCRRQLDELLVYPPAALVLGAQVFRIGVDNLATIIERAQAAGTRVAAYGDEAVYAGCDRVVSDHVAGCRALCERFFAGGCRRILRAWAPGSGRAWLDARDRGYLLAHAAAGLEPEPHAPPLPGAGDESQPGEVRARMFAAGLLGRLGPAGEPVAVLAISDSDAFPLIAAGRLLGRELRVGGYDAYWATRAEHRASGDRPLLSVDKQNALAGERLADLVAGRLAGSLPPDPQLAVLPAFVVD